MTMKTPVNPFKLAMKERRVQYGLWHSLIGPMNTEICAAAGFDWLLLDAEHTPNDPMTVLQQSQIVAAYPGTHAIARLPMGHGWVGQALVKQYLDVGVQTLLIPMVETAEQAAMIVRCTRYPPEGRRGAAFGFAHDDYLAGDVKLKMQTAHERTLVIALIETEAGVRNVDAIAAVPGIDILWLGHFDLTNFMGIPGDFTHPRYLAAVDEIVAAARRHGKTAAVLAADVAWGRDYLAKGFRMIAYGLDHLLFRDALARGISALREPSP
jgi:4-hydroxy-2-oxoheptanedioate aldolase